MRRSAAVFTIAATVALGGCTPQYVQPASGPTAKIRLALRDSSNYFAQLHTYEKPACEGAQAIGLVGNPAYVKANNPENNSTVGMIDGKAGPDTRIIEKVIPANRKFTVSYNQIGPHDAMYVRTCTLVASFTPREGGEYEINYRYDTARCYAQVVELSRTAEGRIARAPVENVETEPSGCKGARS